MEIVHNPRGKSTQLRVPTLRIYYPLQNVSFIYKEITILSKPLVLTRFETKHDVHFEQQVQNLASELRENWHELRYSNCQSLYAFFSTLETSFKYSKYYLDSDFRPQIFEVKTNQTLVNAFEKLAYLSEPKLLEKSIWI